MDWCDALMGAGVFSSTGSSVGLCTLSLIFFFVESFLRLQFFPGIYLTVCQLRYKRVHKGLKLLNTLSHITSLASLYHSFSPPTLRHICLYKVY